MSRALAKYKIDIELKTRCFFNFLIAGWEDDILSSKS